MRRDLTVEVVLPYPIETVWEALTDPEALADWVMPVEDFAPVVGQRFRFLAKPMPRWDGIINCEMLTVDPPRRLAMLWQGSQMRTPTTLTWSLEPVDASTRLRIDHQGFEGPSGILLGFMHHAGWRKMCRRQLPVHLRSRQAV